MVVSKEEVNLQLYYFKQMNWDGKRGEQLMQEASRAGTLQQTYQMLQIAQLCFIYIE